MIVVTGATGSIGRALAARLHIAGVPFRVMARNPAVAAGLGGEVVYGDFDEPGSLATAFAGADQLFLNAGGARPVDGPQPMIRQQKAAIDAARTAEVDHVVKVSVWRAAPGRLLAEGAHGEIEGYLHDAGMPATVLQPSGFMQNFVTGVAGFAPDGSLVDTYAGSPVSYIDADDIAACAAAVLVGGAGRCGTHVLTGPEALTTAEIATLIAAAIGRPVPVADLPPDRLAASLVEQGVPVRFAGDVATLCRDVATGVLAGTTGTVAALTGRAPRTFAAFAAAHAEALRRAATTRA
ncbi:NmrA family NAD(P)-binding protein [Pseudonocardia tropica]|uniref:NmrA family NAD(P)-binding protein n=1 Tax=Pseudonocardia tropica TaxID=681289 RepID=A0ABV1K4I8_9PSEU